MSSALTYINNSAKENFDSWTRIDLEISIETNYFSQLSEDVKNKLQQKFFIEAAKELDKNGEIQFDFGNYTYSIERRSDNEYDVNQYKKGARKDENGEFSDDDFIDGGICESNAYYSVLFLIEDVIYDDYLLIKSYYNSSLVSEDDRTFGIEIGQEFFDSDGDFFSYGDNILEYEYFKTEEEAQKRVEEINLLFTNNWSMI